MGKDLSYIIPPVPRELIKAELVATDGGEEKRNVNEIDDDLHDHVQV